MDLLNKYYKPIFSLCLVALIYEIYAINRTLKESQKIESAKFHRTIDIANQVRQKLSRLEEMYCGEGGCYLIGIHLDPYQKKLTVNGAMTVINNTTKVVPGKKITIDLSTLPYDQCEMANCTGIKLNDSDWAWINSYAENKVHTESMEEVTRHDSFYLALSKLSDKSIFEYSFVPYKQTDSNNTFWITAVAFKKGFDTYCDVSCKSMLKREIALITKEIGDLYLLEQ